MADDSTLPPPTPPAGPEPSTNGHAEPLNIADELKESYLNYAMSVIVSRALPDVRDGLKPSQRRILVAMNDLGLVPSGSTSKCAGIIGETMKRYHPHGDASIYPALVRMAQHWNMRHRLVHPQGNFGSIFGQPPAAHRYTEAKLSVIGAELLADLEYDTVDYADSYDGKYREPLVLPSRFPNLLVNGSDGIAVGMATDLPPHNLREVCDALMRLIDNPAITLTQLMQPDEANGYLAFQGPDFPTGNLICGAAGLIDGYADGRGKITIRGRARISDDEKEIVITEVPYQQTRERLAKEIGDLVKDERIKGVKEVRDESSERTGDPVRLVLYLKRDGDATLILNQLYQYSSLEKTASIILLALVNGRPHVLSLIQMMKYYLEHRKEVIRRRTEFHLREAKRRSHVLEGQLIALSWLDEVIRICRDSASRDEAKTALQAMKVTAELMERALGTAHYQELTREIGVQAEYHMTEAQAEAILRMQLGQLSRLPKDEIIKEHGELRGKIRGWEELISSEGNILAVIKQDLKEIRDKYGEDRKTEVTGEQARVTRLDLIADEDQAVTISHRGYAKRLPLTTYKSQNRGGRGVQSGTRDEDFVEHFFVASTHAYLLLFTTRGQLHWLRVHELPEAGRTSPGRAIANFISFKEGETISSIIPVRDLEATRTSGEEKYLLMGTRRGMIKKTLLSAYARPKTGGIIGINLDDGDELIGVVETRPGDEIILSTKNGMAIRFPEGGKGGARDMGRNTRGVKGIKLRSGDEVVGMVVACPDPAWALLTVCESGYGKRTRFGASTLSEIEGGEEDGGEEAEAPEEPAEETAGEEGGEGEERKSSQSYRTQRRGGFGIRDIKAGGRNGAVVDVLAVNDTDDVMLVTTGGMVTRTKVEQIRLTGRNTQGVRVMNLNEGDKLASVARVPAEEQEPEAEDAAAEAPAEPAS